MRVRIVAGGKVREPFLRQAIDEYLTRLRRSLPVEEVEVPPGRDLKTARVIERAIPAQYELWALDPGGTQPTSDELAGWLAERMNQGVKGIAFVVGGASGLPQGIVTQAQVTLSLSRLTLPHRLARLVLAEQLYRAMTIVKGEPYSK